MLHKARILENSGIPTLDQKITFDYMNAQKFDVSDDVTVRNEYTDNFGQKRHVRYIRALTTMNEPEYWPPPP